MPTPPKRRTTKPPPVRVLLIAGTWNWRADDTYRWYDTDGIFVAHLRERGVEVIGADAPFVWSTDLGGIGLGDGDLVTWKAAGMNLLHYCVPPLCPDKQIPSDELNIICHSHGLQVVLAACAKGLKVNRLVDVCGPFRYDMAEIAQRAHLNIGHWTHFHAGVKDRWAWRGGLFDSRNPLKWFHNRRDHPEADVNIDVPDVGHTDIVKRPDLIARVVDALLEPHDA